MKSVLVIVLVFPLLSYSQKFNYGPRLDINLSSPRGKGLKSDLVVGLQAGGFLSYKIKKDWELQTELLYNQRNLRRAENFMTFYNNAGRANAISDIQLNYVALPLLSRHVINSKLALLGGVQYAYLFYADENLIRNGRDAFKKTDWSFLGGVEFNLSGLALSARYVRGITDINNIDQRYEWYADQFQLGFGIRLR